MKPIPYRICLIEDDEIMGEALSDRFNLENLKCDWFKTGQEGAEAVAKGVYDIAICDIQLPDINGEDLFIQLKATQVELPAFIFTTGYGTIDRAVRLLKLGAHDYLTKPLDIHILLNIIRTACIKARPAVVTKNTLGLSSAMRHIESLLPRMAKGATSVLITGESGVGKEWVARALYRQQDPKEKSPFIAVNCGALTESLLEAELFGYVKGAFTGAARDKKGLFELANDGTLFLDEIGEMSAAMQVKLLRAIQEREIVRVGAEKPITVNIKLICATHQNLKQMVEQGRFREDLYYRIHVIHVHIPPLRERKEDILWLAGLMLETWTTENTDPRTLDQSAEQALLDHPWPGNIRELKHCLERACILSQQTRLNAAVLFGNISTPTTEEPECTGSLNSHLQASEKKYILERLAANGKRIAETATDLGISRKTLWEK